MMTAWTALSKAGLMTRGAFRILRRSPGYAAAVIVSLAVCIGLNTALYTLAAPILVHALPFENGNELLAVGLRQSDAAGGLLEASVNWHVPFRDFEVWAQPTSSIRGLFAVASFHSTVAGRSAPEYAQGALVAGNLPRVLGTRPLLGRWFTPSDAGSRVTVLSYSLWRRQFEGDPNAVGQSMEIASEPWTIVGVMPDKGSFPFDAEFWTPARSMVTPTIVVRRATSATVQQVRTLLDQTSPTVRYLRRSGFAAAVTVVSLRDHLFGSAGTELRLLGLAACALFLIGCANVASLTTARSIARRSTFVVRRALGASRTDLLVQVLSEIALLGAAGWLLALLLAQWALRAAPAFFTELMRQRVVVFSWGSVVFAACLTISAVGFVSVGPLVAMQWLTGETDGTAVMQVTLPRASRLWHRSLIVTQFAFALALLVGALTLIQTIKRLAAPVHLGFSSEHLLVATVPLPPSGYATAGERRAFVDNLERRIMRLPGTLATASGPPPLVAGRGPMLREGFTSMFLHSPSSDSRASSVTVWVSDVEAGYFSLYSIPLIAGRYFTAQDGGASPPVAILNASAATVFFGPANPMGKLLPSDAPTSPDGQPIRVIGVVGDALQRDPTMPPAPQLFLPTAQRYQVAPTPTITVRVRGAPSAMIADIRQTLRAVDPALASARLEPVQSIVRQALSRQTTASQLLAVFAAVATLMAIFGLYSVLSYFVSTRLREFGIRLALGAQPHHVAGLVLGETASLVGMALLAGTGLLWAGNHLLQAAAFGSDPITLGTVGATGIGLGVVALGAALVPSYRASRSDPATPLRTD